MVERELPVTTQHHQSLTLEKIPFQNSKHSFSWDRSSLLLPYKAPKSWVKPSQAWSSSASLSSISAFHVPDLCPPHIWLSCFALFHQAQRLQALVKYFSLCRVGYIVEMLIVFYSIFLLLHCQAIHLFSFPGDNLEGLLEVNPMQGSAPFLHQKHLYLFLPH